ncbi:MAG TPA: hypothetical protein PL110_09660 [Candidatus Eremiobacteraeota bacterium]|nr:MAG: hypothetical protein BWY64_02955 [bacterium ADurb.Bin363]HPZ08369.1 hypothetical protein [Candidatus Eremiobacteraeota bacterium]
MPKVKENEGIINLKIPKALKYKIKRQALKEQTTMQSLILKIIKDYCKGEEDKEWDNFIKAHDNAPKEDPTPEDIDAIERGRQEYARGEYQDFDEVIKELDDEGNSNEIG